jgi:hypothetical protein
VVMYMSVRKIDVVSVLCEWSCLCLSGISMLSLFLVSGHVYMCQEYRCCLCSLWVVMYICVRNIDAIFLTDIYMTTQQGTETTSIFLTHIYMTTHKEQRLHRYSRHIYTWPLTRNRDNIDIPDRHIHDHSQGTETTSIFLTDIYMTTHKEQRQHRYSWQTYTWPLTRNRDNIDIPDTHIHDHSQGTETTSIFLTHIYMTTRKVQRLHRYSWQTYTWPLRRNRDNIYNPDRHIHDHSQETETTSIVYVCHEYRCCLCSLLCGHVYVCQEYRCSLCSLWVVMYMSVRNIDVVSVPCEWSCICLSGISM